MDKDTVKNQFIRDKEFLRALYEASEAPKANQLLIFASDPQLNTLLKFLHFLSTGEITIRKENFDQTDAYTCVLGLMRLKEIWV